MLQILVDLRESGGPQAPVQLLKPLLQEWTRHGRVCVPHTPCVSHVVVCHHFVSRIRTLQQSDLNAMNPKGASGS